MLDISGQSPVSSAWLWFFSGATVVCSKQMKSTAFGCFVVPLPCSRLLCALPADRQVEFHTVDLANAALGLNGVNLLTTVTLRCPLPPIIGL